MAEPTEQNTNETAIAVPGSQDAIQKASLGFDGASFDFESLPTEIQAQMYRDMIASDQALAAMSLPMKQSTELADSQRIFNILDASYTSIPDDNGMPKRVVRFVCEFGQYDPETGQQFTVVKSANSFTSTFVDRFDARRGTPFHTPLNNYRLVRDARYTKVGNQAQIMQLVSRAELEKLDKAQAAKK